MAHAADVSVATVSRVINDAPSVTVRTRDKVQAVIQRLGFAPNPMARALTTGRTRTIAALVPTLNHSIFARFLTAMEAGLTANGMSLVVATTNGDPDIELAKAKNLLKLGSDGFILTGVQHSDALFDLVEGRATPVILTSWFDKRARHPTIGYDNRAIAARAAAHLGALGHRRIAVIHGSLTNNDRTVARLDGVRACGADIDVSPVEAPLSVTGGAAAAARALALSPRPTALLCLSDVLALGALFEVQRRGLSSPEDISLMGFDDLEWAEAANPPLSSIRLPAAEMGYECADALHRYFAFGEPVAPRELHAELAIRGSVSAPR
ncbi:MAG: LacI family DNA-binding transcriptional regulator [Pseudomonadota bacterium]